MDSTTSSPAGRKQLQGIGEVQTVVKSLQDEVDASKVSRPGHRHTRSNACNSKRSRL